MTKQYKRLTDNEIKYVRLWAERHKVGNCFTFSGWKAYHAEDSEAPEAITIGLQVVKALEGTPIEPRLGFISLTEGPGKGGKKSEKNSSISQYYERLK